MPRRFDEPSYVTRDSSGELTYEMIQNYLDALIGMFFKILPLKENNNTTLPEYLQSLQRELFGFHRLLNYRSDAKCVTLLSILQSMIDMSLDVSVIRKEVFRAINIINQMKRCYEKEPLTRSGHSDERME